GREAHQLSAKNIGIEPIHTAAVAASDQRESLRIERDGVHDVLGVAPNLARRTFGVDAIDVGPAGHGPWKDGGRGRRRCRATSGALNGALRSDSGRRPRRWL